MKKIILFYTLSLLVSVTVMAQKAKKEPKTKKATESVSTAPVERMVLISTSMGDMKIKLYNATPQHRDNFIKLANENFYDSLLFHRIIRGFMIQGGDPLSRNAAPGIPLGNGDNGYTVPAEFVDSIYHKKGTLCAARTPNPAKASSGCQFYIVQGQVYTAETLASMEMQTGRKYSETQKAAYTTIGGTPQLDGSYTVYGEVVEGLDVLDKIAAVKTAPGDRPIENVYILKMKVLN